MMRLGPVALLIGLCVFAFAIAQPALAASDPVHAAASLGVNLSFSPNPTSVNSQTQIQVSISGGSPPYLLWFNASIPGCTPPSQPFQQNQSVDSYPCHPASTGTFNAHLDVADPAGDHGSASATLNVPGGSNGGSGSGGSGSSNGTGGLNLSGLQDFLGPLMIAGFVFLGSTVAIAASAVALAVLVPRRLKQIRKALEGEPLKTPKAQTEAVEPTPTSSGADPAPPKP